MNGRLVKNTVSQVLEEVLDITQQNKKGESIVKTKKLCVEE